MDTVLSHPRSDIYRTITDKIIAAIEAGADSFSMPWHGGILPPKMPINAVTKHPYRGINVVTLWVEAYGRRYISGYWASYRQWLGLGAQVRKGERGVAIVFFKELEQSEDEARPRFVARASHVFNSEQVDGWHMPVLKTMSPDEVNAEVSEFVRATGVTVTHGSSVARYRRDLDCIEMPYMTWFVGTSTSSPAELYHAVLLHELTHWTGVPQRLDREFGKRFGDQAYAFEELVAELGAAFLCSHFRISGETRRDHAAYISSWLDILKRDTRAVFTAASKAQEAVEYLLRLTEK